MNDGLHVGEDKKEECFSEFVGKDVLRDSEPAGAIRELDPSTYKLLQLLRAVGSGGYLYLAVTASC